MYIPVYEPSRRQQAEMALEARLATNVGITHNGRVWIVEADGFSGRGYSEHLQRAVNNFLQANGLERR